MSTEILIAAIPAACLLAAAIAIHLADGLERMNDLLATTAWEEDDEDDGPDRGAW